VKVPAVSVDGSIDREKVARGATEALIPVAPSDGVVLVTWGGCGACVVKVQLTALARGVPSLAWTPVDSFAVYVVDGASAEVGANVAVEDELSYETVPATLAPPELTSENVDEVIVLGSMARENVAVGWTPAETPVAASVGVVDVTVGLAETGTISRPSSVGSSADPYTDLIVSTPFETVTPLTVRTYAAIGPTAA
jgi:hypothetical protein